MTIFLRTFLFLYIVAISPCTLAETGNGPSRVTAQQFVDLQEGETPFKGYRRAHAKGICVTGEFVSSGALAPFTTATLFEQRTTPFTGRFSIAGNNPRGSDLSAPVRSLALNFVIDANNQWRIAMNTPPVMAVTNPQDFYAQLMAIKAGTEALAAFFEQHPESSDFLAWKAHYQPAASFSDETYNSINAFYLQHGTHRQAVRWQMVPLDAAEVADLDGPDALQQRLIIQLQEKPVIFEWLFQFANSNDDPDNPAVKWSDANPTVSAGKLVFSDWQAQLQGECHDINFDPNVLPDGIEASDDPILKARSAAYAESYKRRAIEVFNGALKEEKND